MSLHWNKEDSPRWDLAKQDLFGAEDLAAAGLPAAAPGVAIADEWWHVCDDGGTIMGYGWLDTEWGDAQVKFFVARPFRGAGIGDFIVEHLEAEAAARGLNYIYNEVPRTHPDPGWMEAWLTARGFVPGHGDLRRRVRSRGGPAGPAAPGPAGVPLRGN